MKLRTPENGSPWYYWQPDSAWHPNWGLDPSCGSDDFATFIVKATAQPDRLYEMFRWYTGLDTRDRADLIGKQETLIDDLARFLDAIGAPYDKAAMLAAQPVNVARSSGPTADWTPELKQLVLNAEARCLTDYGYDEDGPRSGPLGVPAPRAARPAPVFVGPARPHAPLERPAGRRARAAAVAARLGRSRSR